MNRTDQPGAGGVLPDPAGPALDPSAHAPAVHPLATRWPPADNMPRMSHLAAEAAARAQLRWHRPYQTSARPPRGFDGGRDAS